MRRKTISAGHALTRANGAAFLDDSPIEPSFTPAAELSENHDS
jgi:hypothetical protein